MSGARFFCFSRCKMVCGCARNSTGVGVTSSSRNFWNVYVKELRCVLRFCCPRVCLQTSPFGWIFFNLIGEICKSYEPCDVLVFANPRNVFFPRQGLIYRRLFEETIRKIRSRTRAHSFKNVLEQSSVSLHAKHWHCVEKRGNADKVVVFCEK